MSEQEEFQVILRKLLAKPENNACFDCATRNPQWASVSNGVFVCLNCAGAHRSIGVHLSFIRSASLDRWKPHEIQLMQNGGNKKARVFFKKHGIDSLPIESKYSTPAAMRWREQLKAGIKSTPLQRSHSEPIVEEKRLSKFDEENDEWKQLEEEAKKVGEIKASRSQETITHTSVVRSTKKPNSRSNSGSGKRKPSSRRKRTRGGLGSMMNDETNDNSSSSSDSSRVREVHQTHSPRSPSYSSSSTSPASDRWLRDVQETSSQVERLSIGSSMHKKETKSSSEPSSPGVAQARFGNATSVSSRQFFGNQAEANEEERIRERLRSFEGARSISSADLYGTRTENDEVDYGRVLQEGVSNISSAASEYGEMVSSAVSKYWSDIKTNYLN